MLEFRYNTVISSGEGIDLTPMRYRAISQDAEMYPDPDDFRPERFLCADDTTSAPTDPRLLAFGVGRRCVHFVDRINPLVPSYTYMPHSYM
jgi:cytochrome P450